MIELHDHQKEALREMHNGCVLYGGTGSGKGYTALQYYVDNESPRPLVVITTARKRNDRDWEREAESLKIFARAKFSKHGTIVVDSWNNIKKYEDLKDCFFIFDEQRAVGRGTWAKTFIKIAKANRWILLSATPGDTWMDYVPLFVANGFYKNRTEFQRSHVIFRPHLKYPVVDRYINETKLEMLRNHILVEMPYARTTNRIMEWIEVGHNEEFMDLVWKKRWNPLTDEPIRDPSELARTMRKVSNIHPSRLETIKKLVKIHHRLIVYYNFDYELELLRRLRVPTIKGEHTPIIEYNGHKKQLIPPYGPVLYLVQYIAGAEAWNCTTVDAMAFYSLTYSWKNFHQSQGRIDRLDTPFTDLFYYMLVSNTKIDNRIRESLGAKKDFNEREFMAQEGVHFDGYSWLDDPDLTDLTQI
jgi:hypothetical protein